MMPPPVKLQKGKPRRSRACTACWTCRRRHARCDLTKPACQQCARSELICEGYETRVSWGPVMSTVSFPGNGVCRTPPSRPATAPLSQTGHCRPETVGLESSQTGSARLYTLEATPRTHLEASLRTMWGSVKFSSSLTVGISPDMEVTSGMSPRVDEQHHDPETAPQTGRSLRLQSDSVTPPYISNCGEGRHGNNHVQPLSEDYLLSDMRGNASQLSGSELSSTTSPITRTLSLYHGEHSENISLEYYTTHYCDTLVAMPITTVINPWRTILLPMALEGVRRGPDRDPSPTTALYHFIISVSSFHLSKSATADSKTIWVKRAQLHQHLAIASLQQHILSEKPHERLPLLGALLLCLLSEMAQADMSPATFKIHVTGACHWIRKVPREYWIESVAQSMFYQLFASCVLLMRAQLSPVREQDREMNKAYFDFSHPSPHFSLNYLYGISEAATKALNRINTLQFGFQGNTTPRDLGDSQTESPHIPRSSAVDELERDLLMLTPSLTRPETLTVHTKDASTLLYHFDYICYYSNLVWFKREIRKLGPFEVQSLAHMCFDHIETVTEIISGPFSIPPWFVAVSIFEFCDELYQKKAAAWLDRMHSLTRWAVWLSLKSLVVAFWAVRSDASFDPAYSWVELVRERNNRVQFF